LFDEELTNKANSQTHDRRELLASNMNVIDDKNIAMRDLRVAFLGLKIKDTDIDNEEVVITKSKSKSKSSEALLIRRYITIVHKN
jgi:hypothetical protein